MESFIPMRGRSRRVSLVPLLACLTLAAMPAPPASAVQFGLNALDFFAGPATPYEAFRMRTAGARIIRVQMGWGRIQPSKSRRFTFDHYDEVVGGAARGGMNILGLLLGTPGWIPHHERGWPSTPSGLIEYSRYVQALAGRYGPHGAFWAENPEVPYRPITAWEVWNEPNRADMAPNIPNRVSSYAQLLKLTRAALNVHDPHASIVTGGMTERRSSDSEEATAFLRRLYRIKQARRAIDVIGVHPYGRRAKDALQVTQRVRRILDQEGDPHRPLWITEMGWGSAGETAPHPLVTDERGQADRLRSSFKLLGQAAKRLKLRKILWYSFADIRPPSFPGTWDQHSGLFDYYGRKKPAWDAFANAAKGQAGGNLYTVPTPSSD
jgi:hypothetical protein